MNLQKKKSVLQLGMLVLLGLNLTSCIREELPEKGVDIKSAIDISQVNNPNVIKTTIQESSVTLYVKSMEKMKDTKLNFTVTSGATYSFVEVKLDSTKMDLGNGTMVYVPGYCTIDTTIVGEMATPKDFSKTQYIKVVSEATGLNEDDHYTQKLIDAQAKNSKDPDAPGFIGWEKDGKLSRTYTEGAHLYKIWAINSLPAGIPLTLTFDNWYQPVGTKFQQPFEYVDGSANNIWSSTNASIALMASTNPLVIYGASPTTDVAPVRQGENKSALLLTSNDIRYTKTLARPFLAGCCFIGEYDGSDTGALTCTHVGLPFNQAPKSLSFWYKFLPMTIGDPNNGDEMSVIKYLWKQSGQTADGSFSVPGIDSYIGQLDKGFIRAVLYRTDDDTKWLNGETIRNPQHSSVVAYVEFAPDAIQSEYKQVEKDFTYVNGHSYEEMKKSEDVANWKYNLAIYLASSYEGFRFICGANMTNQLQQKNLDEQMGTKLYIDEMEIKCE